jgi:predicted nucleotidyltransferase
MSESADAAVSAEIRSRIRQKLAAVAGGEGFRVLYAAESGSRAWGFGSPDSDYDVRFIYARPLHWYLRLERGRDVFEAGIDDALIDLSGWDVDKALRLLLRSNPALYEWLVSPLVYIDDGAFAPAARRLFEEMADRKALAHHYRSIASGQWRREIADRTDVRLKKYFYVIRPLLSYQWVLANASPPPMQIDELLAAVQVDHQLRADVEKLIVMKRETPELGLGSRIPVIDAWIEHMLAAELPELAPPEGVTRDQRIERAQALFDTTIGVAG